MSKVSALVSAGWLLRCSAAAKLASPPLNHMKILETSFDPKDVGHQSYLEQHIPSAHFYDLKTGVYPSQLKPKDLPQPNVFEDYIKSIGINNDTHVVVYDKGPMFSSARLWFIFKLYGHEAVSVLNGGMIQWLQCNYSTESGAPDKVEKEGNFTVKEGNEELLLQFEDMIQNRKSSEKFQIVDVRNPDHFSGKSEEPSKSTIGALKSVDIQLPKKMQRGHIHHAVNIENNSFIDPTTNCMIEENQIKQLFKEKGIDTHKPIASMCYTGVSACIVPLALAHIQQNYCAGVYCGSWTEYGQKATADQVEKGDGASKSRSPLKGG